MVEGVRMLGKMKVLSEVRILIAPVGTMTAR